MSASRWPARQIRRNGLDDAANNFSCQNKKFDPPTRNRDGPQVRACFAVPRLAKIVLTGSKLCKVARMTDAEATPASDLCSWVDLCPMSAIPITPCMPVAHRGRDVPHPEGRISFARTRPGPERPSAGPGYISVAKGNEVKVEWKRGFPREIRPTGNHRSGRIGRSRPDCFGE
jgi:hypothetical protein